MSSRKIQREPSKVRREGYRKLNQDEVQEAIWEALEHIHEAEIDLGPKFSAILRKRRRIKRSIPKPT